MTVTRLGASTAAYTVGKEAFSSLGAAIGRAYATGQCVMRGSVVVWPVQGGGSFIHQGGS